MGLILLILLLLIIFGGFPAYRSGALVLNSGLGLILTIVIVLLLVGLLAGPLVPGYHFGW